MLFETAKQLEYGAGNAIIARLTVQPTEILSHTKMTEADQAKFIKFSIDELSKRILSCYETEQRLRIEADRHRAKFRPPSPGDASIEIPHIPRLKEECESFLYQSKNYLRDLLKLINLLWGTQYEDASEWSQGKGGRPSVQDFIASKFGESHVNAKFIRQYEMCLAPFSLMRNAVEHPKSSQLIIKNFIRSGSALNEATWSLEKGSKVEYGPFPVVEDMAVAIRNLIILAEDMLIIWAQVNLVAPQLVEIRVIPEVQRNAQCPVKYRICPTDTVLRDIAKIEATKANV